MERRVALKWLTRVKFTNPEWQGATDWIVQNENGVFTSKLVIIKVFKQLSCTTRGNICKPNFWIRFGLNCSSLWFSLSQCFLPGWWVLQWHAMTSAPETQGSSPCCRETLSGSTPRCPMGGGRERSTAGQVCCGILSLRQIFVHILFHPYLVVFV